VRHSERERRDMAPTIKGAESFTYLISVSLPVPAASIRGRRFLCHRRRHGRGHRSLSLALPFVVSICCRCGRKVAHGRQPRSIRTARSLLVGCGPIPRLASDVAEHYRVFSSVPCGLLLCSVLSSGLGEKLLEILEKIRRTTK
jgi:hypothetical protein